MEREFNPDKMAAAEQMRGGDIDAITNDADELKTPGFLERLGKKIGKKTKAFAGVVALAAALRSGEATAGERADSLKSAKDAVTEVGKIVKKSPDFRGRMQVGGRMMDMFKKNLGEKGSILTTDAFTIVEQVKKGNILISVDVGNDGKIDKVVLINGTEIEAKDRAFLEAGLATVDQESVASDVSTAEMEREHSASSVYSRKEYFLDGEVWKGADYAKGEVFNLPAGTGEKQQDAWAARANVLAAELEGSAGK